MAITLRGVKGSPLTHTELDTNFREFFYSASVEGSSITLYKTQSISSSLNFPVDPPVGKDGYVQLKQGDAPSGSNAVHTASANFIFDYNQSILRVTGSANITGNLTVGGDITAEQFFTEYITSSVVFRSGSTRFGNSADDTHVFTGSLQIDGSATGSDVRINDWGSVSSSLQIMTASIADLSQSVSANYLLNTTDTLNGTLTTTNLLTTTLESTSTSRLSGSLKVTGSTSLTGSLTTIGNAGINTNTPTETLHVNGTFRTAVLVFPSTDGNPGEVLHTDGGGNLYFTTASTPLTGSAAVETYTGGAVQDRIITSVDFETINAESNLGFDGTTLNVTGSSIISQNLTVNSISASTIISASEINASGDITAFYSSDERLKDNLEYIQSPIEKIKQIGGYTFDWNNNQTTHKGRDIGVIAQEIENILPEIVNTRSDGYKAVRYEKIVALLIEAIKDQQSQIDELKSKL